MSFYFIVGLFQTAGVRGGAVLGPLVPRPHRGDDPPDHPLLLHCPPLHPRQDHPAPRLRAAQPLGWPGDVEGLPEQIQEGGVQLEGPGPGQAARGGGQQDGPQQRVKHLVKTNKTNSAGIKAHNTPS